MLTRDGGKPNVRDVMGYKPPQGPSNINDPKGPGLHGDNHGCGCDGTSEHMTGGPGLGGSNHGKDGTQGGR